MSTQEAPATIFVPASRIAGLFALICLCWMSISIRAGATTLDVRNDCGATGNGLINDTNAINQCIAQVAMSGGGTVLFPKGLLYGTYLTGSIHLRSHVTLEFDNGAIIRAAAPGIGVYDNPEPNPDDSYQDKALAHFHNALIWGEDCNEVGIVGNGIIDGAGNLRIGSDPGDGYANKALALKNCDNVTLSGFTIQRAGHSGILAHGIDTMLVENVRIQGDPLLPLFFNNYFIRDGFDLVNSSHVYIDNLEALYMPDDAMVLKSTYALGDVKPSTDIHVSNSRFSALEDNALQFGSETCGDFSNISFSNIEIRGAGEAGISMTSNDGAIIDGVSYDHIAMSNVAVPIWIKTENRNRCPVTPRIGVIRNVSISDVTANASPSPSGQEFTSTISGLPGVPVENVTLTRVDLRVRGGHPASDANVVPPEDASYNPVDQGTKPSYGWWLRHVSNIEFVDSKVGFVQNDGRPALIAMDGTNVNVDSLRFKRGLGSPYDLGFEGGTTFTVGSGTRSDPGNLAPRVRQPLP